MPLVVDAAIALAGFTFVASITPGPNNIMLMASGMNFGWRATIPHMLGVTIGVMAMIGLVGLGAERLFAMWPALDTVLRIGCLGMLLWLAWRLWHAASPEAAETPRAPLTFWQATAFQWLNPKAWTMVLAIVSVYAPDRAPETILAVAAVFAAVNLPAVNVWLLAGTRLRRWLNDAVIVRRFNAAMAVLLLLSVAPALVR